MDREAKLSGHEERNRKLLRVFEENRVDLFESRSIDLHFSAAGRANSERLADELSRRGFKIVCMVPARVRDGLEAWNIEAETVASLSEVTAAGFTATLTDLAADFRAEYEGWGTSV